MATKIQVRRDSAANWSNENPQLNAGEFGYDTTNNTLKVGDGTTRWNSLKEVVDTDYEFDENPAYLRTAAGNFEQTVASTGTTTFDGIIEADGGVNVTGGNLSVPGDVVIQGGGATTKSLIFFQKDINDIPSAVRITGTHTYDTDAKTAHTFLANPKLTITGGGGYVAYLASLQELSGVTGINTGFRVENIFQQASSVGGIGFSSHLDTNAAKNNFNFYAIGNAPNYFRNTLTIAPRPDFVHNDTETDSGLYLSPGILGSRNANSSASVAGISVTRLSTAPSATSTTSLINILYGDINDETDRVSAGIRMDGSGGVELANLSDYRTKENVVDLPSAVDAIKTLRPVNYNYTWAPGRTRPGFVAHELQETLPVAVVGTKDETEAIGTLADYDGTVLETAVTEPSAEELTYTEDVEVDGVTTQTIRTRTWTPTGTRPVYQGVDQTKLIPLLTKALQEALTRIEQLEADHATLMGNSNGGY